MPPFSMVLAWGLFPSCRLTGRDSLKRLDSSRPEDGANSFGPPRSTYHLRLGFIPPQVVEVRPCVHCIAAEEPQLPSGVYPAYGTVPGRRDVPRRRRPLGSVCSCLVGYIRPTHPRPLASAVLPQIIEDSGRSCGVVAPSTEQPEVSGRIRPSGRRRTRPGDIARGRRSQRAVGSRLTGCVRSTHPCPLAPAEFPQVIELDPVSPCVRSCAPEEP
jgi:hypothetical protein